MCNIRRFVAALAVALAVLLPARIAQASPFSFSTSFNSLSADESLSGVATLDAGILKLTSAGQFFSYGAYAIDLGAVDTFDSFTASWKSLIGGGDLGGADGYSFNVAADLPSPAGYGSPGEDGAGTGLSVTVDTFDNGGADVVGIGIVWNGSVLASQSIYKDDDGSGNYLRKNLFVDASVTVTPAGLVTFTYDGYVLTTLLPGYGGLANQIMFGARTGGANDNHWVDELSINGILNDDTTAVPEPATLLLLGAGLAAAGAQRYRRRT